MAVKRGRPAKWVTHPSTGEPVAGLKFWKSRGIFYTDIQDKNGHKQRKYFGGNIWEALQQLSQIRPPNGEMVSMPPVAVRKKEIAWYSEAYPPKRIDFTGIPLVVVAAKVSELTGRSVDAVTGEISKQFGLSESDLVTPLPQNVINEKLSELSELLYETFKQPLEYVSLPVGVEPLSPEEIKKEYEKKSDNLIVKSVRTDENGVEISEGVYATSEVDRAAIIATVRHWMLEDFSRFQREIDLPIFMDYNKVKNLIRIDSEKMLKIYLEVRAKPLSRQNIVNARKWWGIFCRKIKMIDDNISVADLLSFQKAVNNVYPNANTQKNVLNTIKAIINHNFKLSDNDAELEIYRRFLDKYAKLNIPKRKPGKPIVVEADEFHNLLDAVDNIQFKAQILLCWNLGIRQSDICDFEEADLNFKKGTVEKERTKTGLRQCAYLLPITTQALKAWIQFKNDNGIKSKKLFCNPQTGESLSPKSDGLGKYLRRLTKKIGLIHIKVQSFRQSLESVCSYYNCNQDAINIVMGHAIHSVIASYKNRDIKHTISVYNALHDYYYNHAAKMPKL